MASHRDSELRLERYETVVSSLGADSPLPAMESVRRPRVDPNDLAYRAKHHGLRVGYGRGGTLLPYRMQDRFSRDLSRRGFTALVLENDILRATFLPELGGRLWSLVHKASGRELLDANPAVR